MTMQHLTAPLEIYRPLPPLRSAFLGIAFSQGGYAVGGPSKGNKTGGTRAGPSQGPLPFFGTHLRLNLTRLLLLFHCLLQYVQLSSRFCFLIWNFTEHRVKLTLLSRNYLCAVEPSNNCLFRFCTNFLPSRPVPKGNLTSESATGISNLSFVLINLLAFKIKMDYSWLTYFCQEAGNEPF